MQAHVNDPIRAQVHDLDDLPTVLQDEEVKPASDTSAEGAGPLSAARSGPSVVTSTPQRPGWVARGGLGVVMTRPRRRAQRPLAARRRTATIRRRLRAGCRPSATSQPRRRFARAGCRRGWRGGAARRSGVPRPATWRVAAGSAASGHLVRVAWVYARADRWERGLSELGAWVPS